MKQIISLFILAIGLALVAAFMLRGTPAIAAPSMGTMYAFPTALAINKATVITLTIPIPDPALIPNSVNLLKLGPSDAQPTILGILHDDGKSGDAVAGDGIYTIQVPFDETSTGNFQLEVSAAFRGLLRRVVTPPITIAVTLDGTIPLPPDPGRAGLTTLAGIDSNGNGVRDDIERYIALTYPQSAKTRAALTQMAAALESELLNASSPQLAVPDTLRWAYSADCLDYVMASSDADVAGLANAANALAALESQALNTPSRAQADFQVNGELGAFTYSRPNFTGLAARCDFNPGNFPN